MSRRYFAIALAIPFTAVTALALREGGLSGFYYQHRSWGGLQVFSDLVIMALLACGWMVLDARYRKRPVWPFVLLTLAAGSYGPLAYLAMSKTGNTDLGLSVHSNVRTVQPRWGHFVMVVTLVLFAVLTVKALTIHGYFGIWRLQFGSWTSLQVLADLVILCAFGCRWMILDGRRIGRLSWPFVALTVAAGSFGPLLYLLSRGRFAHGMNRSQGYVEP